MKIVNDILNNYYIIINDENWGNYKDIYYNEEYDYKILSYSIEEGKNYELYYLYIYQIMKESHKCLP